eukprot:scaffold124198_cov21-Tisochrysis_lutea.AAC.1
MVAPPRPRRRPRREVPVNSMTHHAHDTSARVDARTAGCEDTYFTWGGVVRGERERMDIVE